MNNSARLACCYLMMLTVMAELRADDTAILSSSLTFHAPFDDGFDARFARADGKIYTASDAGHQDPKPGNARADVTLISDGKYGKALRFASNDKRALLFKGAENISYASRDWEGTVSFWMRLNPEEDLKPGFADPIQITDKKWDDASFFVDFSKDETPRHFRLGVFANFKTWNPKNTPWDKIADSDRPMVTIKKHPFTRDRWTHVAFTWSGFNLHEFTGPGQVKTPGNLSTAKTVLYLDGEPVGSMKGTRKFTWDPNKLVIMLGLSYIGDMDELGIFSRALTPTQMKTLYNLKSGIAGLKD